LDLVFAKRFVRVEPHIKIPFHSILEDNYKVLSIMVICQGYSSWFLIINILPV